MTFSTWFTVQRYDRHCRRHKSTQTHTHALCNSIYCFFFLSLTVVIVIIIIIAVVVAVVVFVLFITVKNQCILRLVEYCFSRIFFRGRWAESVKPAFPPSLFPLSLACIDSVFVAAITHTQTLSSVAALFVCVHLSVCTLRCMRVPCERFDWIKYTCRSLFLFIFHTKGGRVNRLYMQTKLNEELRCSVKANILKFKACYILICQQYMYVCEQYK